jgi:hypothetical protein
LACSMCHRHQCADCQATWQQQMTGNVCWALSNVLWPHGYAIERNKPPLDTPHSVRLKPHSLPVMCAGL